jgi:hypothetical protein
MSNSKYNVTLSDINWQLFDTIEKLKKGEIKLAEAKAISELAQVYVNSSKTQVDFLNILSKNIKKDDLNYDNLLKISGNFVSDGLELEETLKKIESNKNKI